MRKRLGIQRGTMEFCCMVQGLLQSCWDSCLGGEMKGFHKVSWVFQAASKETTHNPGLHGCFPTYNPS